MKGNRSALVAGTIMVAVTGIVIGCVGAAVRSYASSDDTNMLDVRTDLRDLQPGLAGPLDGARARMKLTTFKGHAKVALQVRDIDPAAPGRTFGAHLHTGPCIAGDGTAAGPHYNADAIAGRVPVTVSTETEVWLDLKISRNGNGMAVAAVPFIPTPGNRSIVIHQDPTDQHGAAGPRLACIPVSW